MLNLQGDVIAIVDSNGAVAVEYEYDAWGKEIGVSTAGNVENPLHTYNALKYKGYYYDSEMGLYYVSSRYYDPDVGRFISADTTDILGVSNNLYDKNLYAYCDNNPVMREDVTGKVWDTALDVASFAAGIADVASNPNDVGAWIGFAADAACLALPFVTGGGALVKAITKSDDVSDAIKTARKVDYYVTPAGDAIPRYKGPNNPYHCNPHFHIDRREKGSSGPFRKVFIGLMEWLR